MSVSLDSLEIRAPAKINVALRVLAREEGGYHQIETVFARIGLADTLTLRRGDEGVRLTVQGDVGEVSPEDNLVTRAARAFLERVGASEGVGIDLKKGIPVGAGLGGGSADAAATLRGLNRLHGEPLALQTLMELGALLGSDVPFLVADLPIALGWGRGERLLPLTMDGSACAVLALPRVSVDTGWAYRTLAETRREAPIRPGMPWGSGVTTWQDVADGAVNDFEGVVHPAHPELAELLGAIRSTGPVVARMTGTGSAHFGLFADEGAARGAAETLRSALPEMTFVVTGVGV